MLGDLPFEILSQIVSYLPKARDLSNLAVACHRLNRFIKEEGWRVFVQERFPSIYVPTYWRDAAHALSTYSRNWDRRAFIARFIQPEGQIVKWPRGVRDRQWSRPGGQTMGFQPVIDSYEDWNGTAWSARREVLTYSAGAELVFRTKQSGPEALQQWDNAVNMGTSTASFDNFHNAVQWVTYKPSSASQGTDDITCLKLRRPNPTEARDHSRPEQVVIGRASGGLTALNVPLLPSEGAAVSETQYVTGKRLVKSLDFVDGPSPLLAACMASTAVAIYPLTFPIDDESATNQVEPLSEIATVPPIGVGPKQQTWTVRFLSRDRLAVGVGPSDAPLNVYQVTESGISEEPLRRFHCQLPHRLDDGIDFRFRAPVTSVYQILPLTSHGATEQSPGDVFLTGFHDGFVTVNDMRSPRDYVQTYRDPIDHSAIYSLAAIGRERFVAGGARHSTVKFFDLRMSDGRAYYHRQIQPLKPWKVSQYHGAIQTRESRLSQNGWNLFLNPRNQDQLTRQPWRARNPRNTRGRIAPNPPTRDSPIYSLSVPFPCSPSLFAGIENNIVQLDFTSMMDQHPDTLFEQGVVRRPGIGDVDVKTTWDASGDVLNLAMYEHNEDGGIGLMNQAGVKGTLERHLWVEGYDERWRKSESWKK